MFTFNSAGALLVTTDAVAGTSIVSGGFAYKQTGELHIEVISGDVPATAYRLGGIAVTPSGAVYAKNSAPSNAVYLGGLAVSQDGAVFMEDATPSTFPVAPWGIVNTTGSLYVSGLTQVELEILDSTPFSVVMNEPDAPVDPSMPVGVDGGGFVAKVFLAGMSAGGTINGLDLTINVRDPGYNTSGVLTTIDRTITGNQWVRMQYPDGDEPMVEEADGGLYVYVPLTDWIYSGTTILSATVGATFYTAYAGSTPSVIDNNSPLAYPSVMMASLTPVFQRVGSAGTLAVEWTAHHRHARNGSQIAAVSMWATDGSNTGDVVTVSTPTLSAQLTNGLPCEVYAGTVDTSDCNNGACTVDATFYPWLGNAFQLSVDGEAWTTRKPCTPLQFYNDSTNARLLYAYVDGTGGGTPAVNADPATARTTPYASPQAAANAIGTALGDIGGGIIRLMDDAGADKTYTTNASITAVAGDCAWIVEPDPLNTGVITWNFSGSRTQPSKLIVRGIRCVPAGGVSTNWQATSTANTQVITFDDCHLEASAAQHITTGFYHQYYFNCTTAGTALRLQSATTPAGGGINMIAGTTRSSGTFQTASVVGPNEAMCIIGNDWTVDSATCAADGTTGRDGAPASNDWRIVFNNRFDHFDINNTTFNATPLNMVISQNLCDLGSVGNIAGRAFGDNDLTTVGNLILHHNTTVGNRMNLCYNDEPNSRRTPAGVIKRVSPKNNVWLFYGKKTDITISVDGNGAPGNWSNIYSVGSSGNVSLQGTVSGLATDLPENDNTDQFMGALMQEQAPFFDQPNMFRTSLGFTMANIMDAFVNYTNAPRAVPAKGGDYHLDSADPIAQDHFMVIPAGAAVFSYDLDGDARSNAGDGCVGCYEAA